MFNDWALRSRSNILNKENGEDSVQELTFLVCSLIPLSYMMVATEGTFIVVDLKTIRKYNNHTKEGCAKLVANKYASWFIDMNEDVKGHDREYDRLIIGTTSGLSQRYYFQDVKAKPKAVRISTFKTNSLVIPTTVGEEVIDFSDVKAEIAEMMVNYEDYCKRVNFTSRVEKIKQ